jgi:hypothetical protein
MSRRRTLFVVLVVAVLVVVYYFYGGHSTPKGQPPLANFSGNDLTPLKTAFNNSASSIRVLVMLSPT